MELFERAGARLTLVSPFAGRACNGRHGRLTVTSELAASTARAEMFAAIVIPGGMPPDRLRMRHAMLDLVRDAIQRRHPGRRHRTRPASADLRGRRAPAAPSPAGRRSPSTSRMPAGSTSIARWSTMAASSRPGKSTTPRAFADAILQRISAFALSRHGRYNRCPCMPTSPFRQPA